MKRVVTFIYVRSIKPSLISRIHVLLVYGRYATLIRNTFPSLAYLCPYKYITYKYTYITAVVLLFITDYTVVSSYKTKTLFSLERSRAFFIKSTQRLNSYIKR